ncbi:MAG TPA: hypothetical protein VJJ20_02295 [Candidatus Paceibacterota bacterium]
MHPLHAALCALDESYSDQTPPVENFAASFYFPAESCSTIPGTSFDLRVEWEKDLKLLMVTTAIEGVMFKSFDGLKVLLNSLNAEIPPYLDEVHGGRLDVTAVAMAPNYLAPCFQFYLGGCEHVSSNVVQDRFSKLLFDRAALSLWLTRTVFAYASATGHEPTALERMRLLQLEHGKFQLALLEHEGGMFPRGFYTTLYHENSATRH